MSFDLRDPEQLDSRAPAYALAFAESGRALDAQERAVSELTSRAGVLMAAAAVTTSVFGSKAFPGGRPSTAGWLGVAAFVGVGLAIMYVLWPRRDWQFDARAMTILTDYVEPAEVPVALIQRDITIHRAASFLRNTVHMRRMLRSMRIAMCLLVVEVVAGVVVISGVA